MSQIIFSLVASIMIFLQPVASGQEIWFEGERYERRFEAVFNCTAYTLDPAECGKLPSHPLYGVTASGRYVTANRTIATDQRLIRFGEIVVIEGYGIYVSEDTGGAIRGERLDIYMESKSEAIAFGRTNLRGVVYRKVQ